MNKPRGILMAGNWKMNSGLDETAKFFEGLRLQLGGLQMLGHGLQACVFPPATSLDRAMKMSAGTPVLVGAQNVHWEKKGAFTGEISGPFLKEMGISWALTGHSERRQYFGETDETVRKRTESLLEQGFRVVMCVGETRAEREANQTLAVLTKQLSATLLPAGPLGPARPAGKGPSTYLDGRLVIAYEPVWAIGTGLTASPGQAEEAHQAIRKFLWDQFGMEAAGRTPILYGGSVTPENADGLLSCANIDGALVGGASIKPESFMALLKAGEKALSA